MAQSDESRGGRDAVPRLAAGVDPRTLSLAPEQAQVLRLVDGRRHLAEICRAAPFSELKTIALLLRLKAQGLILWASKETVGEPGRAPAQPERPAPAARPSPPPRRVTPAQPWSATVALDELPPPPSQAQSWPSSREAQGRPASPGVPEEPRAPDLEPDLKRRIDEMFRLVERGDPWRVLGVPRGADQLTLRRAYFRLAKEFHPDRYFDKDLGAYRPRLESLFGALSDAFQRLVNEST